MAAIAEIRERLLSKDSFLEHEAKDVLKNLGLSTPEGFFVGKGKALPLEASLSYPLVAKVSASKIRSKTDAGGIRLGIKDGDELKKAVSELMAIEGAEGVLVEETAPPGVEAIVGGIYDPQFGPTVMFGVGGIYVELYRDVAFALAPLNRDDALWLISQVRGRRLLDGMRGMKPVDREALIKVILAVSQIMETEAVREITLNPVALYPAGAIVLDAKLVRRF